MKNENRYSSIEQAADGTWEVFNDVTGLLVATGLNYIAAKNRMIEMNQHYSAIEFGR